MGFFIQYTSVIENFTSSVTSLIDAVSRIFVNNTFLKDTFECFDLPKEAEDDDKFIKLLCGLYKTKTGKIYLDGKEVNDYKQAEYQKSWF